MLAIEPFKIVTVKVDAKIVFTPFISFIEQWVRFGGWVGWNKLVITIFVAKHLIFSLIIKVLNRNVLANFLNWERLVRFNKQQISLLIRRIVNY